MTNLNGILNNREQKALVRHKFSLLIALLIFLAAASSCSFKDGSVLRSHNLFSIYPGTLPGELDWFYRENYQIAGVSDISTRNGLVYISGGASGKVMVFNSYGKLITYIYDPEKNPAPAENKEGKGIQSVSSWPLGCTGHIAAYDGGFFVEDRVDKERRVKNNEFDVYFDSVVLNFNQEGKYLGHLGREGFGGSPFPLISSIDIRDNGNIVVTCHVPGAWLSYWFSSEGWPLFTVVIKDQDLPRYSSAGNLSVYTVKPDPAELAMHIRMDVYPDTHNGDAPEAFLYKLDIETMDYSDPLELPYINNNSGESFPSVPPEYKGTTSAGIHMFLTPQGNSAYTLVLMDREGRIVQNRRINVPADSVVYRKFSMQNDGLLSGIFFGDKKASVVWWRVDKLIK